MLMNRRLSLVGVLIPCSGLVCGCFAPGAAAQQEATSRVVEASLFKNGLGFVQREVEIRGAGNHIVKDLPVPAHGSFWIIPDSKGIAVKEAVASPSTRGESVAALTMLDLLKANVGRKVEVRTEKDDWFAATVEAIPEGDPRDLSSSPEAARQDYYWSPARAYRPPARDAAGGIPQAQFVLLRGQNGQVLALPPGEIKGIRTLGDDASKSASFQLRVSRNLPGASLRINTTGGEGRLRLLYLVWGLTWAPSYQMDVTDMNDASLHCKATLLNDVEDLSGSKINFITGYPNLAFAEVVDPLALVGDVSDFLQRLTNLGASSPARRRTPVVAQQMVTMNVANNDGGGRPRITAPEEGKTREDLFLYPQEDVTLARGERGYYPLFSKRVPCDDLYVWEVEDSLDEQSRWRYDPWYWYNRGEEPAFDQEEVWHSLRLENTGGIPWTTAPAMTIQEGKVLGQDTMFYTSPGAKTLLKITRSVDVKAEQSELEVERERNAKTVYSSRTFDLVTIKGELKIFNYKSKPIRLLVKKLLSGEVLDTSLKPTIEATTRGVWRVNPQQRLTWETPVEAGGKLYIAYRYKVYSPPR